MDNALIDLIRRTNPDDLIGMFLAVGGLLLGLIVSLVALWMKHRRSEGILQLKSEMLARGMSADDIERVLVAGQSNLNQACADLRSAFHAAKES